MTTRTVLTISLLYALVLAPRPLHAQPPPNPADGVPVRPTTDLDWIDHAKILLERAFVPGARVVTPLHSYQHDYACNTDSIANLIGHPGSAALVHDHQRHHPRHLLSHHQPSHTSGPAVRMVQRTTQQP